LTSFNLYVKRKNRSCKNFITQTKKGNKKMIVLFLSTCLNFNSVNSNIEIQNIEIQKTVVLEKKEKGTTHRGNGRDDRYTF
jgi:hypothetical protein